MCGRYSLAKDARQVQAEFPSFAVLANLAARYNIAPTQPVAILLDDGRPRMEIVNWGLVPPWAPDLSRAASLINARAETLADKPSFQAAFRRKRCLIPADGWYEWGRGGERGPFHLHLPERRCLAFAGLWEEWHHPDGGLVLSCAIITTAANDTVRAVHPRMPALLRREDHAAWLDRNEGDPGRLGALLKPWEGEPLVVQAVSTRVNRVTHDDALCLEPAAQTGPRQLDLFG